MNSIVANTTPATMSSREIAELTGKEHGHVKRDIEQMLKALEKDVSTFGCIYLDSVGRKQTEYRLGRELTQTLITGYSVPLRHKVILRLNALESGQQLATIKDPQLAAMVTMLTQLDVVKQEQAAQRSEMAEIRAKLTATPDEHYTVAGYASLRGISLDTKRANLLGRKAAKVSREHGVDIGKAHSAIYGEVNTYHVDVLCEVFGQGRKI